ncbi:ferritin-like domain-containing protein [Undibacterium sp. Ji83W]|uniref:ferritin-like domain-containing protein n=1 Tax=Undibacterium sp. Ji83W TaxID=3413043 RepID=UPI003BF15B56
MSLPDIIKLIPRNAAALRRTQTADSAITPVAGNPVSTRLESGVGNCYPGLEADLRNLERRFFPFLEVDIDDTEIRIVAVDSSGIDAATTNTTTTTPGTANTPMSAAVAKKYRNLARDISQNRRCTITGINGNFGPFGNQDLSIATLSPPGNTDISTAPPDAWTAIRLLPENTPLTLTIQTSAGSVSLQGKRSPYLSSTGSLAAMFEPGELTQSLCSPWTHDFRDCGCFYWASNHPDIAQPPTPDASEPGVPWLAAVPWERLNRSIGNTPPVPADINEPEELGHYAINHQWQTLNFVLEGRETIRPYKPGKFTALPLASREELQLYLRYAAGLELAAIQEYLSAAYSLLSPAMLAAGDLRNNVTVSFAELMRIAYGEMRHLRAVNNVLLSLNGPAYTPALQVAKTIPDAAGNQSPVRARILDRQAILDFLALEQANTGADKLYARIYATLRQPGFGSDADCQSIRYIMAEGQDHFETFENMQVWLQGFQPSQYLHQNLVQAPASNSTYKALQKAYRSLLEKLYAGYQAGMPQGAVDINSARSDMVAASGFGSAARAVINAGFLLSFDTISDARFTPIAPPPGL